MDPKGASKVAGELPAWRVQGDSAGGWAALEGTLWEKAISQPSP